MLPRAHPLNLKSNRAKNQLFQPQNSMPDTSPRAGEPWHTQLIRPTELPARQPLPAKVLWSSFHAGFPFPGWNSCTEHLHYCMDVAFPSLEGGQTPSEPETRRWGLTLLWLSCQGGSQKSFAILSTSLDFQCHGVKTAQPWGSLEPHRQR